MGQRDIRGSYQHTPAPQGMWTGTGERCSAVLGNLSWVCQPQQLHELHPLGLGWKGAFCAPQAGRCSSAEHRARHAEPGRALPLPGWPGESPWLQAGERRSLLKVLVLQLDSASCHQGWSISHRPGQKGGSCAARQRQRRSRAAGCCCCSLRGWSWQWRRWPGSRCS